MDNPTDPDDPTFEEVVAALLKVDPEGITGQTAGKGKKKPKKPKKPKKDEGPAPE